MFDTVKSTKVVEPAQGNELTMAERRADNFLAIQKVRDFQKKIMSDKKFVNKRKEEYERMLKVPLNLETTLRIKMPAQKTLEITLGRFGIWVIGSEQRNFVDGVQNYLLEIERF